MSLSDAVLRFSFADAKRPPVTAAMRRSSRGLPVMYSLHFRIAGYRLFRKVK
ncbi:hypothetical protein OKW29_003885 [Paraburkholderia sp. CI3]